MLTMIRFNPVPSQTGPHELSTDNDNTYLPYQPPQDLRQLDSRQGGHGPSPG
jgi:hypothetical protein